MRAPRCQRRAVPVAMLLLLLLNAAAAYPNLFVSEFANGCTDHPARSYAGHGAPVPDKATTFELSPSGGGAAAAALCPGVEYEVRVKFGGGGKRRSLLTASAGAFGSAAGAACPNRAVGSQSAAALEDTLTLPCSAAGGPPVQLKATSAAGGSKPFEAAAASLPVEPLARCPGSPCPGAPPAAAAAPAAAAVAAPVAPAAAAEKQATAGAGGCGASTYGYACRVDAGGGAWLHYTAGGGGAPPDNACTAAAGGGGGALAGAGPSNRPLHLLLEAPAAGYLGLGFPRTKGHMVPADAVIGSAAAAGGQPTVSAYHLTDYSPQPSPTNFQTGGWAAHMGAARAGPMSLLCLSRLQDAPSAAVSPRLDLNSLAINWAGDPSTRFVQHELTGSLGLDAASGAATVAPAGAGGGRRGAAVAAHGALMLVAFAALMPLGALAARHKWLAGDAKASRIRPAWFHAHRGIQALSVLLALAGFVVALVCFDVPWGPGGAPPPHRLYDLHRILGVVVMGFAALQVAAGLARPGLMARSRPAWRAGHLGLGWLTLALATVVVFAGVVIMHELRRQPLVNWLLPVVLLLALLLAAAVALEARKHSLQRRGTYNPRTHAFGPGAAGARNGTAALPKSVDGDAATRGSGGGGSPI